MSYAILELHLEQPTASLERHGHQWRSRCERCGGHSKGYLRVSHALAAQERHARVHLDHEALELSALFDTFRRPLEVRPARTRRRVALTTLPENVIADAANGLHRELQEATG